MVTFERSIVNNIRIGEPKALRAGDECPLCGGRIQHWKYYDGHQIKDGQLFCSACLAVEDNWKTT